MIVEIRTYRLHPGTGEEFVRLMREEAMPLLAAAGIRVLDAGLSLVADDGHQDAYLIRTFDSIEDREAREEAFYGSDAWRQGPREAILSKIVSYHTVVIDVPDGLLPESVYRPATARRPFERERHDPTVH
jgi:hypothetical protein